MLILDGGMGQELVKRAGQATDLWAIKALIDSPQTVRDVHDAYFKAGAEIATTNTYALWPERLIAKGLGHQLEALTGVACTQAVQARDANGSGKVAGSLGPPSFSYQTHCPPIIEAAETYAHLSKLQSDYVDFYILETMSSLAQAESALMGVAGQGKPVWLCITVDDGDGTKLRSGEAVADIQDLVTRYGPEAVLINCSVPEAVSQGLPILTNFGKKFGAYANGFTHIHPNFDSVLATVDLLTRRHDLTPEAYLKFVQAWIQMGASIVGGCCEIGPEHIQAIVEFAQSKYH